MTADEPFQGWVKLEIMGHRQRWGFARDVQIAGGSLLRIDIPTDDGDVSEFYGASAIFCMTPMAEEICRDMCKGARGTMPRPVQYRLEEKPADRPDDGRGFSGDDDEIDF